MGKIVLAYFSIVVSFVLAEKCTVYQQGDTIPPPPVGGRECFQVFGDTNRYCIEYDCPTPACPNPVTSPYTCPYCTGTCVHGGQVYQWGESYTCPDGCNTCTCSQFGGFSTQMACFLTEPPVGCQ